MIGKLAGRGWPTLILLAVVLAVLWQAFHADTGPLSLFVAFAVATWVALDATNRKMNPGWWGFATLLLVFVSLPIYLAVRSLRAGETREGGRAWNVLKNFALTWTILCLAFTVLAVNMSTGDGWSNFFAIIIMGFIWFVPMFGALVLGLFLKKSSVVERGPTGKLAIA